jgi:hypothetical protein
MKYSFKQQLAQGKRAEEYIDTLFIDKFFIAKATREDERRGIDRHYTKRGNGRKYTIQYKVDKKASEAGNAFIEIVSVDTQGIPGWAYTCQADFIFYYIDNIGPIYILRPKDIKRKLETWKAKYTTLEIENKTYKTAGIIVPLNELERLAVSIADA